MQGKPFILPPEQFQSISKAIADPRRFAIFEQIARQGSMTCSHLNVQACLSAATISHHIGDLQRAGLIGSRREGRVLLLWVERAVWEAYLEQLRAL